MVEYGEVNPNFFSAVAIYEAIPQNVFTSAFFRSTTGRRIRIECIRSEKPVQGDEYMDRVARADARRSRGEGYGISRHFSTLKWGNHGQKKRVVLIPSPL